MSAFLPPDSTNSFADDRLHEAGLVRQFLELPAPVRSRASPVAHHNPVALLFCLFHVFQVHVDVAVVSPMGQLF